MKTKLKEELRALRIKYEARENEILGAEGRKLKHAYELVHYRYTEAVREKRESVASLKKAEGSNTRIEQNNREIDYNNFMIANSKNVLKKIKAADASNKKRVKYITGLIKSFEGTNKRLELNNFSLERELCTEINDCSANIERIKREVADLSEELASISEKYKPLKTALEKDILLKKLRRRIREVRAYWIASSRDDIYKALCRMDELFA